MKHSLYALCALCLLIAPPAIAETTPTPLTSDPRIANIVFDENAVYRIEVHPRYAVAIQFMPGETVKTITLGDSASWDVKPLNRGDVLSLKPLAPGQRTNMTVFTDLRIYTFELNAHRATKRPHSHPFRIKFVYPNGGVHEFGATTIGSRNDDYFIAGEAPFKPLRIYDNGAQTIFVMPDEAPTPAVFSVGPDGSERIVNVRSEGARIVADAVSPRWSIRIGENEICVAAGDIVRQATAKGADI